MRRANKIVWVKSFRGEVSFWDMLTLLNGVPPVATAFSVVQQFSLSTTSKWLAVSLSGCVSALLIWTFWKLGRKIYPIRHVDFPNEQKRIPDKWMLWIALGWFVFVSCVGGSIGTRALILLFFQ